MSENGELGQSYQSFVDGLPLNESGEIEETKAAEPEKSEEVSEPEPKAEDTKPEETVTETTEEAKTETPEVQSKLDIAEKRRKDSERTYQEEHQRLLEAEKQRLELEAKLQQFEETKRKADIEQQVKADEGIKTLLEQAKEKWEDDPLTAMEFLAEGLATQNAAKTASVEEAVNKRFEELRQADMVRQETTARATHTDYDEVVNDGFITKLQSDAKTYAAWQERGGTAEAGYQLGKELKDFEDYTKDPEAFFKQREEARTGTETTTTSSEPTSLSGIGSKPVKKGEAADLDEMDQGTAALAGIASKIEGKYARMR